MFFLIVSLFYGPQELESLNEKHDMDQPTIQGILYHTKDAWTVWIQGEKITPATADKWSIASVSPQSICFGQGAPFRAGCYTYSQDLH